MASMQDAHTSTFGAREETGGAVRLARLYAQIEGATVDNQTFARIEERYRQIAARCLDTASPAASQILAVSSSTAGEGASSVAIGIATAAARNLGASVLIVESDMQNPHLAADFGTDSILGLSDYLTSDIELETVVKETPAAGVWLLAGGRKHSNPGPLVRSARFNALMVSLRGGFQTIIIDTPPLLTSPHAAVIAEHTDGLVLVVRAGRTHKHEVRNSLTALGKTPVRGVVLNRTGKWLPDWTMRLFGMSRFDIE